MEPHNCWCMMRYCCILLLLLCVTKLSFAQDSLLHNNSAATPAATDPVYNDANWKWGVFYCNVNDNRIFPPKGNGMGWTVNFSNPFSVGALVLVISIILLGGYLLKKRKGNEQVWRVAIKRSSGIHFLLPHFILRLLKFHRWVRKESAKPASVPK